MVNHPVGIVKQLQGILIGIIIELESNLMRSGCFSFSKYSNCKININFLSISLRKECENGTQIEQERPKRKRERAKLIIENINRERI